MLLSVAVLFAACSKEDTFEQNTDAFETTDFKVYDDSNLGRYIGVFTTEEGFERAAVEIKILVNQKATALFNFPNGDAILFTSSEVIKSADNLNNISFTSEKGFFTVSISDKGETAIVSGVEFENKKSSIIILKDRTRAPVLALTGTYTCTTCSNPDPKTFNTLVSGGGTGAQTYLTQTSFQGVAYPGIGVQENCASAGLITFCEANSGDGTTTTVGFSFGAGDIDWNAEMVYSNIPPDCAELSGIWFFKRGLAGQQSGTFRSDAVNNCLTEMALEDFEDATVSYTTTNDFDVVIPEFSDGFSDYFTRTDGSNINTNVVFTDTSGTGFFAAQDIDAEGEQEPLYVNFMDMDHGGASIIYFSAFFAEDDSNDGNQDWDIADNVMVQYSFDNTTWVTFFAIEGDDTSGTNFNSTPRVDTDFDGVGDGAEITSNFEFFATGFINDGTTNPTSSATVSVRVRVNLDSGDEDIAFDNILIRGL